MPLESGACCHLLDVTLSQLHVYLHGMQLHYLISLPVQVLSFTHTVWEWAIVGYMFFDSRSSTSSTSWVFSRLIVWLLSKVRPLSLYVAYQRIHRTHVPDQGNAFVGVCDCWQCHLPCLHAPQPFLFAIRLHVV
jgi:hypothetical protein